VVLELLIDPELHQRALGHAAKEILAGLNFEQTTVLDNEFERDLQGDSVGGRATRRLRNPWPEVFGPFGRGWSIAAVIEEVRPHEPELVQYVLGLAARAAVQPYVRGMRDNPERRILIVMGWTADGPFPVLFPATTAPFGDRQRPVPR